MSGTNAHGVPSRTSRVPSARRIATTKTWPRGDDPIGATMHPLGVSWRGHAFGIRGAPAVAMMQWYGAWSERPRLPSPTTTVTSPNPDAARFERPHSARDGFRSIEMTFFGPTSD